MAKKNTTNTINWGKAVSDAMVASKLTKPTPFTVMPGAGNIIARVLRIRYPNVVVHTPISPQSTTLYIAAVRKGDRITVAMVRDINSAIAVLHIAYSLKLFQEGSGSNG